MPFDLFITSADGTRTFKSGRSSYPTREETERTVWVVTANQYETKDETMSFVRRVSAAPVGETIHHEATGVAFRTEEI